MKKLSLYILTSTFILASCGGGGGGGGGDTHTQPSVPIPTASISADPTSVYVENSTTLTWSSSNATSCSASGSWDGTKSTSGSEAITINQTGELTFTITCTNSSGSAEASVTVTAEYEAQFKETPIIISDLNLYPEPCNTTYSRTKPSIQFVIPLNINNDGWEDFIVHQWCDIAPNNQGEVIEQPTPDLLVVHLSNGDGTYRNGNMEVFNENIPSLGGASRKYDKGDFNGDGRDDFAFAMNWEDGRSGDPWEYSRASPAIILSKGETEYEVVKLGTPDWGHAVAIVEHENGNVDALFAGFTGIGLQAYRYSSEGWQNVIDEYPPEDIKNIAGITTSRGTATWAGEFKYQDDYIIATDSSTDGSKNGFALWSRENGIWSKTDQQLVPVAFNVGWISWQGSLGTIPVYAVNGENVIGYVPQTMCFFEDKFDDSGYTTFLALFQSSKPKAGTIIEGETYSESELSLIQGIQIFQIQDNKIVPLENPLDNYDDAIFANFMECRDINEDGYGDFVREVFSGLPAYDVPRQRGGTPVININNTAGQLIEYENNQNYEMPGHSELSDTNHGQGYIKDINGDGIEDIVVFGNHIHNEMHNYEGSIEIYLGYYNFSLQQDNSNSNQTETVNVSIEANSNGSGNVYVIDGTQRKSLTLNIGTTYSFNHSSSHPLRFSTTDDGTHEGGSEYIEGVTKSTGVTTIEVTSSSPTTLYYYCDVHSGMGAGITIN